MKVTVGIAIGLVALFILGWVGFRIQPKPFAPYPGQTVDLGVVPLRDDLPAPVEWFYRAVYGDQVPVVGSAVISGRAEMRLFGLTLPGRFRFAHDAGQDYRHYIETTWYGLPILKVNEWYLDGKSRLELPFGVVENEPKVDQAANLGLWAESVWLPAVYLTDPRVRWEPVDEETALLFVPFGEGEDTFVVRFDPRTGMVRTLEAMRYKDAADEGKTLWINEGRAWRDVNGIPLMAVGAATWFDEGTPWAVFTIEDVVYNVDVSEYVRAAGL